MENILNETKFLMNKYKIKANKSLGQNFLIDDYSVNKIVESANISNEDLVIEIGPGFGTLTKYLLEKANKVICIELDKRMIEILTDRFNLYKNFEIKNEDVLKIDLQKMISNEKEKNDEIKNVKIVANLPYYITTPIITKILESNLDLDSIVVMIQKEVADRLIEIPGGKNTGAITYCIYYYCESEKILEVPKESFIPSPKVTSEVIRLRLRKKPPVQVLGKALMFKIIKCAYMQRRKTILNSLTNTQVFSSKEEGSAILEKLNLDINIRPEKLTIEDFASITNEFINRLK